MADDYSNDVTTEGVLATGSTVTGMLETVEDADWFKLDLKVDHGYYFTPFMANGQVPLISVWMEGFPMVRYTTQPGGLFSNDLYNPFIPRESGTYFVEVYRAAQAGDYTIGLHEAPDDSANGPGSARLLTAAASVAGKFDYAFDTDQFRIAAVAGTTYTVTLSADSGDIGTAAFVRLSHRDVQTTWVEGDATTRYTFTAKSSGDYVISAELASSEPPSAGGLAYHISVSVSGTSGPGTPIVNPGTPPVIVPTVPPVIPPVVPPVVPPTTPPVVPVDVGPEVVSGAGTVDGAIVVTLSEAALLRGQGSIELRQGSSVVETWEAGDSGIHLSGKTLTLHPEHTGSLMPGKYSLSFVGNILTDTAGNVGAPFALNAVDVRGTSGGGVTPVLKGNSDHVRGSDGLADAVVIAGKWSDYKVSREIDGFKVTGGSQFTGTVSGIERVMFTKSDEVVALSLDGHLGQAFRLYTAAFDRMPDQGGLGYWLNAAELGTSLGDIARSFIASKEFSDLYGPEPGDGDFLDSLYQNVLHREGESGGVAYWMDRLSHGADRGDVLAAFSESAENQEQAVALIGNGVVYTPYG
jgi:hypothetical protein